MRFLLLILLACSVNSYSQKDTLGLKPWNHQFEVNFHINLLDLSQHNYFIEGGFKWHQNDILYWQANVIVRENWNNWQTQIYSFGPMLRFTWKRIPWIHWENYLGLNVANNRDEGGNFQEYGVSGGVIGRSELQFDFRGMANLFIGTFGAVNYGKHHYRWPHFATGQYVVEESFGFYVFWSEARIPPPIYLGVNFYFNRN